MCPAIPFWPECLLKDQLLRESPCVLFVAFPFLLLIFVCVCLIFVNLINMSLGVFHLGFILFGTLWVSWTWVIISFHILGKFSNDYLLKYFLMVFLFVFFFWDSYDSNVGAFNILLEVFEIVLISFNSFFFFPL